MSWGCGFLCWGQAGRQFPASSPSWVLPPWPLQCQPFSPKTFHLGGISLPWSCGLQVQPWFVPAGLC